MLRLVRRRATGRAAEYRPNRHHLLVSVRKVYEGLQSLCSIRRVEARRRNASALSVRFSKSAEVLM
jgi:hypothetical protein